MTQNEALELIVKTLDSKKAEDIKVIKIKELSVLADYFVIADGTSSTQTRALADEVEFRLKEAGLAPNQIQGNNGSNWMTTVISSCTFSQETRGIFTIWSASGETARR